MTFNLTAFVRDHASAAGIPPALLSAVEHRAEMARKAARYFDGFAPLRGSGGAIVLVSSLDGIEREIEAADRALCRRVVAGAVRDFDDGVLERRC